MAAPMLRKKTLIFSIGLMLVGGVCNSQTIGGTYGKSSTLGGLTPYHCEVAGVFAERPLGKHFLLSTGLNYVWRKDADNGPFPIGCFPPPGEIVPQIRVVDKIRLLELPVEAGYWLAGRSDSRTGLRMIGGASFVYVLQCTQTRTLLNGEREEQNLRSTGEYPHAFLLKLGLEGQVRLGKTAVVVGFQVRHTPSYTSTVNRMGSGFLYLKTGLRFSGPTANKQ